MHKIHLPNGAKNIISALEEAGCEAYVVGGCVRDRSEERRVGKECRL